ncbi:MAG: hypothetical protein RI556_13090, partial [Hydrogenovibrio sp.]|nr:hypothetical protein [Hydrogenovibrio sp.]
MILELINGQCMRHHKGPGGLRQVIIICQAFKDLATQLHAKLLKEPKQRLDAKTRLVRLLYERGYSREQVIELFKFIDWMIRLPDNLDIEFKNTIDQIEEEMHMAYVTSVERIATQEGMQQG